MDGEYVKTKTIITPFPWPKGEDCGKHTIGQTCAACGFPHTNAAIPQRSGGSIADGKCLEFAAQHPDIKTKIEPDFKAVATPLIEKNSIALWEMAGNMIAHQYKSDIHPASDAVRFSAEILRALYNSPTALAALGLVRKEDTVSLGDYEKLEQQLADAKECGASMLQRYTDALGELKAVRQMRNSLLVDVKYYYKVGCLRGVLSFTTDDEYAQLLRIRACEAQQKQEAE